MDLEKLVQALIDEGLSETEAIQTVARNLKRNTSREKSSGIQARDVKSEEETPQQAKERWIREEFSDPNGLFHGGATSGGVFGDGPIVLEDYDPGAYQRNLNIQNQLTQIQVQQKMLQQLEEMQKQAALPPKPTRQLPEENTQRGIRRLLGRKKR